MAGKIPRPFIDQLLQRTDIVDVVNRLVTLKRAGKDYQACCPFHDEKTPSFTVSRDKQFYHCFGCGAHGSAIGFLMEYERLSFPEAVEELARQYGMEVPREISDYSPTKDLRPILDVLAQADGFFRLQLRRHPSAAKAVDYLVERGLTGEVAAEYGVGYAPPGWDSLMKELLPRFGALLLAQAGLVTEADAGKAYDRFRDRIIFPIRDGRGRVLGFGGRVLGDEKPKYLNSPETPVFHKGRQLYGLYEMQKALRRPDQLLVVEGYMDVVALAQQGIRNVVATLGTATTPEHLELVFRHTSEVVFCFDGDRAGREAGWKALKVVLPLMSQGRAARFLFLPEGEDPDSLVRREGATLFEERIRGAQPLSDYLLSHLASEVDMGSIDGRARFAEAARGYVEQLPDGLFKQMLWRRLAESSGAPVEQLSPAAKANARHRRPVMRESSRQYKGVTPVRQAIILLLKAPRLALLNDLPEEWRAAKTPGIELLRDLMERAAAAPDMGTGRLLEYWRGEDAFRHLVTLSGFVPEFAEDGYEAEFRDCLKRLQTEFHRQEFFRLAAKGGAQGLSEEEQGRLRQLSKLMAEKG